MQTPDDKEQRRAQTAGAGQPRRRLSKGQELALFVAMMVVLLALVVYGLRA